MAFIDRHCGVYGVGPMCALLVTAPSTYSAPKACQADPVPRSPRESCDEVLRAEIEPVWEDNFRGYGVRKVWRMLQREGWWCGPLHGGKADARSRSAGDGPRPTHADHAPRARDGLVAGPCGAARRGWRAAALLRTDLALDALEQTLYERAVGDVPLVHHSDRGTQ